MNVWPQWRSSLEWDFFAIVAYLMVSILYWYVGMIPDLATLRDRAPTRSRARFYGFFALGWRGEARHWRRFETLSLLLAGLAVPLVFSVHSMVALDFSEGLVPGWHSSIFPPFFVAGACSPASPWCWRSASRCAAGFSCRHTSPKSSGQHGEDDAGGRPGGRLQLLGGDLHAPSTAWIATRWR